MVDNIRVIRNEIKLIALLEEADTLLAKHLDFLDELNKDPARPLN